MGEIELSRRPSKKQLTLDAIKPLVRSSAHVERSSLAEMDEPRLSDGWVLAHGS